MIITIDGPASSGKSTVAKLISKKLGFIHFDSGALFRGITAYLLATNFDISSITDDSDTPNLDISMDFVGDKYTLYINNIDYTPRLRDVDVSNSVAKVALNRNVRKQIDAFQRQFAEGKNIIVDGRDTGSHVYPDAEYKFYLDCSVDERARRRLNEYILNNQVADFDSVREDIAKRDLQDKTRKIAPLVVPHDAIVLDSTNLTIDEVMNKILEHIHI